MERRTLIVGSGSCAVKIAHGLLNKGIQVLIAAKNNQDLSDLNELKSADVETLLHTRVVGCKGFTGNFDITLDCRGIQSNRQVAGIIIAEEAERIPKFSDYGLKPSLGVVSIQDILAGTYFDRSDLEKFVFLSGLKNEENHVITEDIMQSCLRLQNTLRKKIYILTKNLKVSGNGLEQLYRNTKEAGVVYVKFTKEMPDIQQDEGKVKISFTDEITGEQFRISPDVTVVDETISPAPDLKRLANIFHIDTDLNGFVQSDNVHRLTVSTNRRGIIAAGPSRAVQSYSEQMTDAAAAVLNCIEILESDFDDGSAKAEINSGKCVKCLTCYRICPHKAISLNTGLSVIANSCESCGICTAECPQGAVKITGLDSIDILYDTTDNKETVENRTTSPNITAFCCRRSASKAWEFSSSMELPLPRGLRIVDVPCGGSVSYKNIYSAFKTGADGVLVLTCHDGNCNSEKGHVYAKRRVNSIREILEQMGFGKERLMAGSLASNMGKEFSDIVNNFNKKLQDLGPSRITKS